MKLLKVTFRFPTLESLPIRSPLRESSVLERSLQIAQSEHRPAKKKPAHSSFQCQLFPGKKKEHPKNGVFVYANWVFSPAFYGNKENGKTWENVGKTLCKTASPHPQEWPWHSTLQRSVGPRPTKWDGDAGQHSKPAPLVKNIQCLGKCGRVRPYGCSLCFYTSEFINNKKNIKSKSEIFSPQNRKVHLCQGSFP